MRFERNKDLRESMRLGIEFNSEEIIFIQKFSNNGEYSGWISIMTHDEIIKTIEEIQRKILLLSEIRFCILSGLRDFPNAKTTIIVEGEDYDKPYVNFNGEYYLIKNNYGF